MEWSFSQVKGSIDDDITEADIISCVEFNPDGDLLATGDKGGRVVIFKRDEASKKCHPRRSDYSVYTTFQSHEPEFDYLKSLEIEEKINKIKWLKRKNAAHFLLSTNDKTIKLWKISERDKQVDGFSNLVNRSMILGGGGDTVSTLSMSTDDTSFTSNITLNTSSSSNPSSPSLFSNNVQHSSMNDSSILRSNYNSNSSSPSSSPSPSSSTTLNANCQGSNLSNCLLTSSNGRILHPSIRSKSGLRVPIMKRMELIVEASPRKIYANAHTYHVNSISINSDGETFLSADDLRINLWNLGVTDESFNIVDIKPANMEELTEVITAAEFHPNHCNYFVYSSSKGIIRLCDMRAAALCDQHAKVFEEPDDPTSRSFFSEIISSISGIKFSNSGRHLITRDYLSVKVWDLNMNSKPVETYQVHEYLRSKLCSLYENDYIFDKFECCFSGDDRLMMTGSYNNFFKIFDRSNRRDVTFEASKDIIRPRVPLKPKKVAVGGGKKKKDEIGVDSIDFNRKILYSAWHPKENIVAVAATNNLYIFHEKQNVNDVNCNNTSRLSDNDNDSPFVEGSSSISTSTFAP